MRTLFLTFLLAFGLSSCDELTHIVNQYPSVNVAPTQNEVVAALKDALKVGITNAVLQTNKTNGFYGNSLIKIPMPPEADKIKKTLTDIGYTKPITDFEQSLNRAAEQASGKAVDIFVNSITQMTITDAMGIWKGDDDAATQYLKRTSTAQLEAAFSPITKKAIESVGVTKYWDDVAGIYNQIPFVTPVNPDLEKYVNHEAIEGLFKLVAQEEKKIRDDPAARTTDILKRVFGYNG
jgi:RNA binding exosome subunit